jgi:hypothetical protein
VHTFVDNAGRTWTVAINVAAIKAVRAALSVDLMETAEGKLLDRLAGDPVLLCDTLYVLCRAEAEAQKVTDEDFGRSLGGDAIDRAAKAFLEELVDFFPSARRHLLAKVLEKMRALEAKVIAAVEARIDDPELEKTILDGLGGSSGNSPASSDATPVP